MQFRRAPLSHRCLQPLPGLMLFVALAASCCWHTDVQAQLEGRIADKPLGTGYVRGVDQQRMMEYITELSGRLKIADEFVKMIAVQSEERMKEMTPKVKEPLNGAAYYLVQGLIPSWETMYFQQVADVADAKRVLNARKKTFGHDGKMETDGEDRFKLIRGSSWSSAIPKGKTAEEHAADIKKRNGIQRRGYVNDAKVIEKDGEKAVEQSWTITEFYRFHDNMLFSGNFEELWETNLPTAETLLTSVRSTDDMGIEVFFDRVPPGIKQLLWGMLSGGAGAEMQQRDGEETTMADLRKRSIQFGLDLVKAVMFDVDQANGWLRFATEEEQSIRGEVNIDTRSNSDFAKRLGDWGSGNSRFGPILRDDAPATLHLCTKIFEEQDPMLDALGRWFVQQVSTESNGNSEAVDAATEIARSFSSIGEHRTLEVLVKAGWSEETDGVIYGGIQVDNNPNLLKSIYSLANSVRTPPEGLFEMTDRDGVEMFHIRLPDSDIIAVNATTSLTVSHVYIAHQNSCLWVAIGGETAYQKLLAASAACGSSTVAMRAPLLTAKIEVDRWMELPEDDPVGVGNLLRWLDENEPLFPPNPESFNRQDVKPTPLLERVFELGGEQNLGLTIIGDKAGLRLSLKMGEAFGNYYVARMMDTQNQQFTKQRKRSEEARKEANKKAKAAAKKK